MKLIQITDTHFSPTKRHFNGNWAPLLAWLETEKPDLIIHTGDLTIDGADQEEDIAFSLALMRQASAPMLILPGNHDVGHLPGSPQPVDRRRLDRWNGLVGADRFVHDIDGWRLIGFNSLLLGMGDAAEEEQLDWLATAMAGAGTGGQARRIALFTHKPLFVDAPDEGDTGYWSIRPAPRARLLALMERHDVGLFASGHLHWAWQGHYQRTALTWGPSAAFVIDKIEREMPGERLVGAVVHEFSGAALESRIVKVPGMVAHVFDDVIDEIYPRAAAPALEAAS
ncbi:metallophosphoesterase [Rhizobium rhizosphaerae]|uniref:Metallophosphoesterase n=1 Tax=Xaviernesmea rhizosphaerae TaxID=1672749 RepID=A0A1Q9AHT4_9HYPH|nr:metallophosphoesterase [Xaviernesmea rhizosphaerae]OLP54812.1 metallophosphoesterase [Xaviernesmea rhizosphaerae]